jgi:hypothetical protein
MRSASRLGRAAVLATALFAAAATPALAATGQPASSNGSGSGLAGARGTVFVQTDNPAGNQVIAYDRQPGGTLSEAGAYPTGGLGGIRSGSVVDHLASQGSLALSPDGTALIAVNAGATPSRYSASMATGYGSARSSAPAWSSRSAWPSMAAWCTCSMR